MPNTKTKTANPESHPAAETPPEPPLTGQALANKEAQDIEDAKNAAREREADEQAHLSKLRTSGAPPLTTREKE